MKSLFISNERIKFLIVSWSVYFVLWTFIGVVSSIQNYIVDIEKGKDFGWLRILTFNLLFWWFWLFATPVIFRLSRKIVIRSSHYVSSIILHCCFSIVFVFIHEFIQSIWCNWLFSPDYYLPLLAKFKWRLIHLDWVFVDWIAYWAIVGAFYAFDYYRRLQERELRNSQLQTQVINSKLLALKMQIHPHFLFNTLNALSTIVKQGKKKKADTMIAQFAGFLRMTLEEGDKDEIPLAKEIEFVQHYLEIEKIRFQDKLEIQLEVHPSTYNAFVPALFLQPIVENAVRYAIAPKESAGTITLRAWRKNVTLIIEIEDDGSGLSSKVLDKSSFGIGLKNVQQRLKTLYGEAQEFSLQKINNGGCVVRIELPFKTIADSSTPVWSAN